MAFLKVPQVLLMILGGIECEYSSWELARCCWCGRGSGALGWYALCLFTGAEQRADCRLVQYSRAQGALVIGVDTGSGKRDFVLGLGAHEFIDFATEDPVMKVQELTGLGAHAVVVTAGSAKAFAHACDMLRVGGSLSCVGIPPGKPCLETPICTIVIKGLRITGNLVGSLKECMEAVDLVRRGVVKPVIEVCPFRDLPRVYEEMEKGDIAGRVVLQVAQ